MKSVSFQTRPFFLALIFVYLTIMGTPFVFASHYELEDVPFLHEGELTKLRTAGVTSTERLLAHVAKIADRQALAAKTGISNDRMTELAHKVDLLRVNGIGPKMVAMLQAAGVLNLKALAKEDSEALHKRVVQVNDELHISQVVPMAGVLHGWIGQAKTLPTLLQD